MSLFSRLFARHPAYNESAYGPFYGAVVSRLTRPGVKVGRTAHYPRVEVHSFTESGPMDKEGALRTLSFTVESIGNSSLPDTIALNQKNIELLTSGIVMPEGWICLGAVPDQLQDLTEASDSAKIIYRLLQAFTVWVEREKTEDNNE